MRAIFEDLERELVDAARREAAERRGRTPGVRPRTRLSAVARTIPALAVLALCLSIAILATTSLHGRSPSPNASPGSASAASGAPADTASVPTAPDYRLPLSVLSGARTRTLSLSSFHGRFVLVAFFASWCQPCQTEVSSLRQAQAVLARRGGTVIGIPFQNQSAQARVFAQTHQLHFPVLADDGTGTFAKAYGVTGVPDSYLIDPQGEVIWTSGTALKPLMAAHTLTSLMAEDSPQPSGGCASRASSVTPGQRAAVQGVLDEVQLLRDPAAARDRTGAACLALTQASTEPGTVPYGPSYRTHPVDLRYAAPGLDGGEVFMYARAGVSPVIADRDVPSDSGIARFETEPEVCLITVGGGTASPNGCESVGAVRQGPTVFEAAQIVGTARRIDYGVVGDGVTAVRVYEGGKLLRTVLPVHNVVQVLVDHNAPAAAYLKLQAEH